jgi:hypothetical protein
MNPPSRLVFAPLALGIILMVAGCVIPTVSLHSFRDVTVPLSDADSGKPVVSVPFRVHYEYYPADSPIVYHLELRTPKEVRATTDASGKAAIKLADYAWSTLLEVHDKQSGYGAMFVLSKELIRKGGTMEPRDPSAKHPKLRLEIHPLNRPNHSAAGKAGLTSRLTIERQLSGLPDPGRSA